MSGDEGETKPTKPSKLTERETLEQEKIALATELGIWQKFEPVENYAESEQFKKIEEIDKRLAKIING
jgi:hypothetical protein